MDSVPDEVLLDIFNYFDGKCLKNVMLICKRWHSLITQSASTMRMLPLKYSSIIQSDEMFVHNFHSLNIQHISNVNFSKSIFEALGNTVQCIEISYCILSPRDLKVISSSFINLNFLSLTKVKLFKDPVESESDILTNEKSLILNKLILLKVDHEILDYMQSIQSQKIEIIDCHENAVNQESLINFISHQKHLTSLNIGEMNYNINVFFHQNIAEFCKFRLKKFHSLFCSNHSHVHQFEDNFISFLESQSKNLENVKISGRSLPPSIYKFVVSSLINMHTLEIDASSVPQENSFYENMARNLSIKSLIIYSTVTKHNFNGLKGLLSHYPCIEKLNLMDTDEFVANDLFHSIAYFLTNLKELVVLNFNKTFDPQTKIKHLEKFSIKIINNIEQLLKFIKIHDSTLINLSIWWITRDFESRIVKEIISLPKLTHLKIGGRFIANKRIYEVVRRDYKNLRTLHLIVNNYDEVKHLKFTFPLDKSIYTDVKCLYFEEDHDREPLND
ncbi:unnamed protein product [Chironomus riparius]|uniref:F-box domain-containing protein n=1 Tax=Chironomus riparius TaxID=315576 RepID=A0A9N9RGD5_9DIPT|nr:unnamed protein product [Chironomus riparius]